ncbi:MAG: ATP synthase F1 subunit gamma [Planctomycetota bacterium]|jgi:F-type H+-transporting ATPase subunit gamma|nr:ATP synthase F1 subunit gamma [Planctomycetota bacterium]
MQTQDIKRRIKSVKSTQQITRAMKFVAAAKLRRAQERMLAMRPYADSLEVLIQHIALDLIGDEHPLLVPPQQVKRVAFVVIAGDRGLCGGFNTTLIKGAMGFVRHKAPATPVFFSVGKQATNSIRKNGYTILKNYHDVFEKLSYVLSGSICDQLVEMATTRDPKEHIDEAYLIYSEFVTMLTQRPVIRKLLPLDLKSFLPRNADSAAPIIPEDGIIEEVDLPDNPDDIFDLADREDALLAEIGEEEAKQKAQPSRPIYELLPDPTAALERLISRRMATEVYRGTLESYAAELAARMTAMDNATANADEMISDLTLSFNRARQTGITGELLDIIGGANALG